MQPVRLKIVEAGAGAAAGLTAAENALRMVPGVLSARAEPASGDEVRVEAADTLDPELLIEALQDAGFVATLIA